MSVINQMLRDLEDREPQPEPTRAELAAIKGIAAPQPDSPRRPRWLAPLSALIVLSVALGAGWIWLDLRIAPELAVVAELPIPPSAAVADAEQAPIPEPIAVSGPLEVQPEARPEPMRLTGFRHAGGVEESTVALHISGGSELAPVMEVGSEQGQILLPGVAINGIDVGSLQDPRIRRFALQEDGEALRVSYAAAPGIRVKVATDRSGDSGPAMTLAFAGMVHTPRAAVGKPSPVPEPVAVQPEQEPAVTRRAVPSTAAERADGLFRQAAVDLRSARPYSAEAKLRGALREQPGHAEAARVLGSLLMADGRTDEAGSLLGRALRLNPESGPLAQAYARLKLQIGAPEQAVAALESTFGQGQNDADYLALLAAAYQRTGRYDRSAAMFESALRLRPDTAKWWAGLGISLEAGSRGSEARTAFQRSVELGGLDAELGRYIQSRLDAFAAEG